MFMYIYIYIYIYIHACVSELRGLGTSLERSALPRAPMAASLERLISTSPTSFVNGLLLTCAVDLRDIHHVSVGVKMSM